MAATWAMNVWGGLVIGTAGDRVVGGVRGGAGGQGVQVCCLLFGGGSVGRDVVAGRSEVGRGVAARGREGPREAETLLWPAIAFSPNSIDTCFMSTTPSAMVGDLSAQAEAITVRS